MSNNDGNLIPIGRFSQVCRLTIKALRHYAEIGLLPPALVDPQSGYRYYSLAQVATADRIRRLRAVELPLDEIAAALRDPDPAAIGVRLTLHQRQLERQIAALEAALTALLGMLEPDETTRYAFGLVTLPERPVVMIGTVAPPTELSRVIPRAFAAVGAYLQRQGIAPNGDRFVIYHDSDDSDNLVMEIGFPVAMPCVSQGGFTARTLPATAAAFTLHHGPYDLLPHAYTALAGWIGAEGHEADGPPLEVYLNAFESLSPHDYRTAIYWPLRATAPEDGGDIGR